jgi:deglycase
MGDRLKGKRIAFLATDGVEQVELDTAERFPIQGVVSDADPRGYDGLVLPGGVANPDRLRTDPEAVAFVGAFFDQGKPVASICHGPWTIVEAGAAEGRTMTSWPSLRTDIRNAGGRWVDEELCVDGNLATSRRPDDLPAFCAQMVEMLAAASRAPVG